MYTRLCYVRRLFLLFIPIALPIKLCLSQPVPSDTGWSVVGIGPYYRVLQQTVSVTNSGVVSQQVQSFTELEDGMNYLSNGVWVAAQDLIEVTPTGAQAIHGQMTANFSSDITSAGAVTLTTAGGEVFQSHPVGLFYRNHF